MKESYSKGIANHADPESCEGARKDALEALTGEEAGRANEPRKLVKLRGADAVMVSGRQHRWARNMARVHRSPRGRRTTACKDVDCTEAGRSRSWLGLWKPSPHREPLRG